MNWTAASAIALFLAVAIGAFGAHVLQGRLDAYSMEIYQRAVLYHFLHALGILAVSLMPPTAGRDWVCRLLLAGILLFCGSLYALALTGNRMLGAITPFGGLSFLAGWLMLAITAWRARPPTP